MSHTGRQWCLGITLFAVVWLLAIALAYCVLSHGGGYWLELFNGATWPSQFVATDTPGSAAAIRSFWFYLILGLRTVLNLGVLFTAVLGLLAFYLLSTGQFKEWFMSKLDSVLSTRDIAFAAYIDHAMSEHKLELTEAQRESLYQAAEAFHSSAAGRAFLKSSKDAATAAQQPARQSAGM